MSHVPTSRRRRRAVTALLAALVVAAATTRGARVVAATSPAAPAPAAPIMGSGSLPAGVPAPPPAQPTAEYLDALAHAGDRIAFQPGPAVTVALQRVPAPTDGPVDPGIDRAAAGTTSGPPGTGTDPSTAAGGGLRREVLGFLPYWEVTDPDLRLDYASLSTIAYFAVTAGPDGHLETKDPDGTASIGWGGWTSSAMTRVIDAAHAQGTRVVLTVERFAWTSGQAADTTTLLASSSLRAQLAGEIAAAVHTRGADGVNLDFEPIPAGQAAAYVAFVRQVRAALDKQRSGYELTFDATGSIGNYDITDLTAPGAADAVMIMGYDYRGAGSAIAGSIDPLAGPMYDLTDTVDAYLKATAASHVILGVPYYGRAWTTVSGGPNAATVAQTSRTGYSVTAPYDQAAGLAAAHGRQYDTLEQAPWTTYRLAPCSGCPLVTRELYYDDAASLGLRYDLVNRKGLRGAGIWALGYDGTRPELAAELRAKFGRDSTPPVAGLTALPATEGDEGFTVAWQGRDDQSGIAWYDVQVSIDGGPWQAWLDRTTATSAPYPGQDGHGYAFRVRAADGSGNVSPYDVSSVYTVAPALRPGGFATVLADGVNVRAAAGTSAAVVMQASAGTRVAILAGPVSVGGLAWYEVTLPVTTWGPTADVETGVWMAAGSGGTAYLAPIQAPNATLVQAVLNGFSFGGAGAASLGPAGAAWRTFSPNGDGHGDTLRLVWVDAAAESAVTLSIFRPDGTRAGVISLGARAAGAQHYDWDGRAGGTTLAPGTYLLQLAATDAHGTHHAPTTVAAGDLQVARYGISLHHVGTDRVAGPDRYATAAAISAASFAPGVPVAVIATGTVFADALGASAAAAAWHGPVLLVQPNEIPSAVAAELRRLRPARLVIAGGTSAVSPAVATALAAFTRGPVTRLSGPDRYGTAAALSAAAFSPGVPIAYVATGVTFPDGAAAAAAAAHAGGPLLLSLPDRLPAATAAELRRLKPARIVVVGSTAALTGAVASALAPLTTGPVSRLGGVDRYATAAAVVEAAFGSAATVYLATGAAFPDALTGAALGQPLLLVPSASLPPAVRAAALACRPLRLVALGGPSAVPAAVLAAVQAALGG